MNSSPLGTQGVLNRLPFTFVGENKDLFKVFIWQRALAGELKEEEQGEAGFRPEQGV